MHVYWVSICYNSDACSNQNPSVLVVQLGAVPQAARSYLQQAPCGISSYPTALTVLRLDLTHVINDRMAREIHVPGLLYVYGT